MAKCFCQPGGQGLNALAAGQLHTRKDEMQFMMARVAVTYPKDIALIWLQARESYLLKLVHQPLFLLWLYRFVRVPGQHPVGRYPQKAFNQCRP